MNMHDTQSESELLQSQVSESSGALSGLFDMLLSVDNFHVSASSDDGHLEDENEDDLAQLEEESCNFNDKINNLIEDEKISSENINTNDDHNLDIDFLKAKMFEHCTMSFIEFATELLDLKSIHLWSDNSLDSLLVLLKKVSPNFPVRSFI